MLLKSRYHINKKNDRGFTLLEILVSLAIASIIILLGYQLVINVIKINKKSEDRQQATLIGQQVVEEIRNLNETYITSDEVILGDNLKLKKKLSEEIEYFGVLKKDSNDYKITLKLEPININFDNNSGETDLKYDFKFDIINDENELIFKDKINNKLYNFRIDSNGKMRVIIENKSNKVSSEHENIIKVDSSGIFLDFTQADFEENIDIEIYNYSDEKITIYAQKPVESNINIKSMIGTVEIFNNPITSDMGYLYNMNVNVLKGDKLLFDGYINKNLSHEIQ